MSYNSTPLQELNGRYLKEPDFSCFYLQLINFLFFFFPLCGYLCWTSLVVHMVKNLPAIQETQVRSLGQEDLLEKEMAAHSSILAWRIPRTEEPSRLQLMGSQSQTQPTKEHNKNLCYFFITYHSFLSCLTLSRTQSELKQL